MNDLHFMPHQEEALNSTEQFNRCAYYLDMGLGKTFVGAEKMYLLNNSVNLVICQNFTAELDAMQRVLNDLNRPYSVVNGQKKDLTAYENADDSITYHSCCMGYILPGLP